MNNDPASVAAVIRMLPDTDLDRLLGMQTPSERAAVARLLPDEHLVRLLNVARDSEQPHAAPSTAAAPAVSGQPARPANRSSRRTPAASDEDVAIIVTLIRETSPKGTVTRGVINTETSDPTWTANGWGPERVKAALATALDRGVVVMHGKNKGAHYVAADAPPDAPPAEEGAPTEPAIAPLQLVVQS